MLMLGRGGADAGEYLHMAAVAALTEVAVAEARDETEQTPARLVPRGAAHARRPRAGGRDAPRRAARLRPVGGAASALCADPGERAPGPPDRGDRRASGRARSPRRCGGRVYALLPGTVEEARAGSPPGSAAQATVGISSHYADAARRCAGPSRRRSSCSRSRPRAAAPPGDDIGGGTYRLLFRVLASHPEEVRGFYEDTVAPLVRYDDQYSTDLRRHARRLPRPATAT